MGILMWILMGYSNVDSNGNSNVDSNGDSNVDSNGVF